MISFAGQNSDEHYLVVEHFPQRIFPKRKYTIQKVPGRSGDIYLDEGEDAFENYDQNYSVFMDAKAPGLPQVSRGIAEWLLGNPGYQRLEDSYDPDFFRLAAYISGEGFINVFNEYGRGTMTFNCNPKRFYKSGEQEFQATYDGTIYSPSSFKSHPIFKIKCLSTGKPVLAVEYTDGTIKTFRVDYTGTGTLIIDSEAHTVVGFSSGNSYNNKVESDYENLYLPSVSRIRWNNVDTVKIIPRWWTI